MTGTDSVCVAHISTASRIFLAGEMRHVLLTPDTE
jgi:hypothetical protein